LKRRPVVSTSSKTIACVLTACTDAAPYIEVPTQLPLRLQPLAS
jgi:hypothetical protein